MGVGKKGKKTPTIFYYRVMSVQSAQWELVLLKPDLLKIQINCSVIFLCVVGKKNTSQLAHQISATFCPLFATNRMDAKSHCLQWSSATVSVWHDGKTTLTFPQQNPEQLEGQILSPYPHLPPAPLQPSSISFFKGKSTTKQFRPVLFPLLQGVFFFSFYNFMIVAWYFRTKNVTV